MSDTRPFREDNKETTNTSNEIILEVSDLRHIYPDGTVAVNGINFHIRDGDFCVIIGPSGCGKSTTLHSVAGKINPTAGKILLDGEDIVDKPTYNRDLGLVFQDFQLFPHMTAKGQIEYGLSQLGLDNAEIESRVNQYLNLLQISDLEDRKPGELSAGQKQRIALARSLALEPKLLLLDEPLGDMDYNLQKEMERELHHIHQETETTFLYVTHDQTQAMRLADQIVVLNDGLVEQSGTVEEIYNKPETAFVATFVGDSNTFTGRINDINSGEATVETQFGELTASTNNLHSKPRELVNEDIIVAIRPSSLKITENAANTLDCTVIDIIQQINSGTQIILDPDSEDDETDDETSEFIFESWDIIKDIDETITIGWDPNDMILLEKTSVASDIDLDKDILGE